MRIALSVQFGRDDQLIFAQQLGVECVLAQVDGYDEKTLVALKNRVEKTGLRLAGIDGLALADAEQAVNAVRNAATAGIPLISCTRPSAAVVAPQPTGRGGALVQTESASLSAFPQGMDSVVQAAAERDVALAWMGRGAPTGTGLDLPLSDLGDDPDAALGALDNPVHIARAHSVKNGASSFLDEGDVNLPRAIMALKRSGFNGPLLAHHPLGMVGDSAWGHKARAYDLGYLKAVLQALNAL